MSISKRITINCSHCGKALFATIFPTISSDAADDIAAQIISGDFFAVKCPHCKFVSHLEYDILYHDLRRGAMIWAIHPNTPDYKKRIAEVRTAPKPPYQTFRIVADTNALRETVTCLENGRDDRIIALYKAFSANYLRLQQPDFVCKSAVYTIADGKEQIRLYDGAGREASSVLSDDLYDHLQELYLASCYAAQFDDNYPIVDHAWAETILPFLLEDDGETLAPEEDDAEFSGNLVCPKCKVILPEDSNYCPVCGVKLSIASEPAALELRRKGTETERKPSAKIKNKKKKKRKILFISIGIAVAIVFIAVQAILSAHNDILRNFATEEMKFGYTNVYADIVYMAPEYYIYTKYTGYTGGHPLISDVICKCKTVEGKSIWITINSWQYPGGSSHDTESFEPYFYNDAFPKRVFGRVTTASRVIDELEGSIGDVFILDVKELQDE